MMTSEEAYEKWAEAAELAEDDVVFDAVADAVDRLLSFAFKAGWSYRGEVDSANSLS
jgi:hypothetical protein